MGGWVGGASGAPAKQQAKLSPPPPPVSWIGSVRYASPVKKKKKKLRKALRRHPEPRSGAPFMPHGIRSSSSAAAVAESGAPPLLLPPLLLAPGGGTGGAVVVGKLRYSLDTAPEERRRCGEKSRSGGVEASERRACRFHRFIIIISSSILIWLSICDRRTCAGTK